MNVHAMRSKKSLALILGVTLLLALLALLLIPGSAAKYRSQTVLQANAVRYSEQLASELKLTADTADEKGVSYNRMLPGTQSVFTPTITVVGKTEIPAYLYLEVTGPETSISEGWTELEGLTGLNGGRIYAYDAVLTGTAGQGDIELRPGITLNWSAVPEENTTTTLRVYAYMIQQTDAETDASAAFAQAMPEQR